MNELFKTGIFNDPFNQIFDVYFKDIFDSATSFAPATNSKFTYPVNVIKEKDALKIEIAAIGLDKEDIKITYENEVLRVSYKKEEVKEETSEEDKPKVIHKGICSRSFDHAWKVGRSYNIDSLTSKLEKGLLTITIPVAEESKPKTFTIE